MYDAQLTIEGDLMLEAGQVPLSLCLSRIVRLLLWVQTDYSLELRSSFQMTINMNDYRERNDNEGP